MSKYYDVLKALREADEVDADYVYKLAVNALYNGEESIDEVIDIVKEISRDAYDKILENIVSITSGLIRKYAEDGDTEKLKQLADCLGELRNSVSDHRDKVDRAWAWARLFANPTAVSAWNRLKEAIENHDWVEALNIYASGHGLDEINTVLSTSGKDPRLFWSNILFNAIIMLVRQEKYEDAYKLLDKYGSLHGDDYDKLRRVVVLGYAQLCGKRGDTQCLDSLISKTSGDDKRLVFLSWIQPILRKPEKYDRRVLETVKRYAEDFGLEELAAHVGLYLDAGIYADKYVESLKDALLKYGEKLQEEITEVIRSGDASQIRKYIEENKDKLSGIIVMDDITLKDYLSALAWFFENNDRIAELVEQATRLEEPIDRFLEDPSKKPDIDPEDYSSIRDTIISILQSREYEILRKTNVISDEVDKNLRSIVGFTYFAEALSYMFNNEKEKARQLIDEARKYSPAYGELYMYIELVTATPSIHDLECILESEGLLKYIPERGEYLPVPIRTPPPVSTAVHTRRHRPSLVTRRKPIGSGEHAPFPI